MQEKKLLQLLKKKAGFFEAILELSHQENQVSLDAWMALLEQKKILLSCIEDIDTELSPFKNTLHTLSQDVHEELEKIRKTIQCVLQLSALNQEKRKQKLVPEL